MIVLLAPNAPVSLEFLSILIKNVWISVYECLVCMDVCVTYACLVPSELVLEPLELELGMAINYHVGVGNC